MEITRIYSVKKAHDNFISSLSFNPSNDKIIASSCKIKLLNLKANDTHIKIWKTETDDELNLIETNFEVREQYDYKVHLYGVNQIEWNPEGSLLASAGNDCNINIVDVNRQKINRNFRIDSCVTCIDFNYSSNLILAGTYDNQIILFDLRSKNLISQILAHSEPITSVSFSGDSTVMMSSSYDGFCRLWDTFKGNCLKTIVLEKSPSINKASFLSDMNHLLISTMNNQIQVMDLYKEEEIVKYTGHVNSNFLVDLHTLEYDENVYLISGSEDGCLYMWNVEEGGEGKQNKIEDDKCTMNCISINKTGIMATAGFANNENIHFFKLK